MNHAALHKYLRSREKQTGLKIRVSLVTRKDSFHYNAFKSFDTSSVIKLPIQLLVEHKIAKGKYVLGELIALLPSDSSFGSGVIARDEAYRNITALPLSKVMELNIHISDCVAANMLIRLAGGKDKINEEFAKTLHLKNTELYMEKIDFSESKRHQLVGRTNTYELARLADYLMQKTTFPITNNLLHSSPRSYVAKALKGDVSMTSAKTGTNWWGYQVSYEIINEVGFFSDHSISYAISVEGRQMSASGKFSPLEPKVLTSMRHIFSKGFAF